MLNKQADHLGTIFFSPLVTSQLKASFISACSILLSKLESQKDGKVKQN